MTTRPASSAVALGYGVGLRPVYFRQVLDEHPAVDWFEVISENFMVPGGNARRVLREVRARYPVALHGVSLSVGSDDPLDEAYLARLAALIDEVEPPFVSDHLCWTGLDGKRGHDLWPLPYTAEALARVIDKVARVQDRLRRRILLENPSSYLRFADDELPEWAFLAEVARRADCGILLDVNNVVVSGHNHGFSWRDYLAAVPAERVGYIHLAGHTVTETLRLDTHDAPVADEVWTAYAEAVRRFGPRPTMIERDDQFPPLAEVIGEAERARAVARAVEEGSWRAA
ncbi:MAG: DUF692 domain-containing protein [Myxococcales bacterium]|nr:DUF692 domain-containing protein [Myxococcales bacterium]